MEFVVEIAPKREVLGIEQFSEADIEAVRRAEPPEESEAFNEELDDER